MRGLLSVLAALGIVYIVPGLVSAQTHLTATLSGAQENPPVTTAASGTGSFTLVVKRRLSFCEGGNGITTPGFVQAVLQIVGSIQEGAYYIRLTPFVGEVRI